MLSPDIVESLLKPISESLPSGDDLEYNPDFMALEADSQAKAEQQFGETVIAAVEPDWRDLLGRSIALLGQTKDVRTAVLCLRAATRTQGIVGLELGLSLLTQMIEQFWDTLNPKLDPDDNNDPTMRVNALAILTDGDSGPRDGLRDIDECLLGSPRSLGPLRVRDIMIASGKLPAGASDPNYTTAQIEGALRDIHGSNADALKAAIEAATWADKLQTLLNNKLGIGTVDLKRLRVISNQVRLSCQRATGDGGASEGEDEANESSNSNDASQGSSEAIRGDIRTREQALLILDKVIQYMERAEPGNPAPLLIARAKRLVGVNFLTIMEDLAPDAMGAIQNITGRVP